MGGKRFYCLAEHNNEQKTQLETGGGNGLESTDVAEDLSVPFEQSTLNFWLCKFICEVAKKSGERYPPKTAFHLLVCRKVKLTGKSN